ncbi:MAG TPA: hypothetical protein VIJ51_18030 [Solirubrobacteraceae bacterium]
MQTIRVALTDALNPTADPYAEPLVLVRLTEHEVGRLTATFAQLVSRSMGGLDVVLLVQERSGDLRTWGNPSQTLRVATLDVGALSWLTRRVGPAELEFPLDPTAWPVSSGTHESGRLSTPDQAGAPGPDSGQGDGFDVVVEREISLDDCEDALRRQLDRS